MRRPIHHRKTGVWASQAAAMAVRAQAELAEYKKEEQDNEVDQSEAHNNPYDKKAESGSIIDLVA